VLTTERAVLIRYMRDGKPRRGSGLQLADQFVLTANHCADGTDHRLVAGGAEHPATVFVRSGNTDADLAILLGPTLPAAEPLQCAVLDRDVPREAERCRALGFPVWKDGALGPRLAQVPGNVPTAEGTDPGESPAVIPPMSLKITNPDIGDRKVLKGDLDQPGSPWAGMSGAVIVTADDLVVGVIRGHSRAEGTGSLTATRLEAIKGLPESVAGLFLTALRMPDPLNWPKIPPLPPPTLGLSQSFTLTCDVDPLEGGGRVDFGGDVGAAYLGGFKFRLTLGNAGDRPMAIRSMRIDAQSHDLPALARARPERGYGKVLIAHQLFAELSRNSYTGWWMLSDGTRLTDDPRPFDSSMKDIFESPGHPRIGFSLDGGESEFIEGAIMAREPGLYDVRLLALAVDAAAASAAKSTSAIRLCYMKEVPRE
jgi:hypothetical protein